jgi:hypothetical protein
MQKSCGSIGSKSESSDVVSPRGKKTFTNSRLCDMIEDENLFRMPIHKPNGLGQMLFEDQDVVFEVELFKLCDASIEILSQHKLVIGLILNRMTDSLHLGKTGNFFKF